MPSVRDFRPPHAMAPSQASATYVPRAAPRPRPAASAAGAGAAGAGAASGRAWGSTGSQPEEAASSPAKKTQPETTPPDPAPGENFTDVLRHRAEAAHATVGKHQFRTVESFFDTRGVL